MNPSLAVIAATIAVAVLAGCTKKTETPPVPKTSTVSITGSGPAPAG